jgi:competence protein ComEA
MSDADRSMRMPIDINHASARELAVVVGIGDDRARQIVEWRRKRGPFETIDDLQHLPLFEPADVAALRGLIKAGRA